MGKNQDGGFKNLVSPIIAAVVAALIAFGGVYLGLNQEKEIWSRQNQRDEFVRITDRRMDLISDMAGALTNAQRAKLLDKRITNYNKELALEAQLCFDAEVRKQNERSCQKMLDNSFDASDAYLQHANMQSAFLKALVLADVYFCEDTRAVLKTIEELGGSWWEIGLETQGLLLRTMKSEIRCGLDTD